MLLPGWECLGGLVGLGWERKEMGRVRCCTKVLLIQLTSLKVVLLCFRPTAVRGRRRLYSLLESFAVARLAPHDAFEVIVSTCRTIELGNPLKCPAPYTAPPSFSRRPLPIFTLRKPRLSSFLPTTSSSCIPHFPPCISLDLTSRPLAPSLRSTDLSRAILRNPRQLH